VRIAIVKAYLGLFLVHNLAGPRDLLIKVADVPIFEFLDLDLPTHWATMTIKGYR